MNMNINLNMNEIQFNDREDMIKKYLIDLDYREASFKGAIDQRNRIRDYLQRNNVDGILFLCI